MGRHQALKPTHLLPSSNPSQTHPSTSFHIRKSSLTLPTAFLQSSSISALAVGDRIPGFKTSAAFLSNLHSNIFIELDSYDSPIGTPDTLRPSFIAVPPSPLTYRMSTLSDREVVLPESLSLPEPASEDPSEDAKEPTIGEDGLPILRTSPATKDDLKVEALHIIADSVAQQRDLVSTALIYHPIVIAVLVAAFAMLRQIYTNDGGLVDYTMVFTTFVGVIFAVFGGIRMLCGPYIPEAEKVGAWKWLDQGRSKEDEEETGLRVLGESDEILLTRFGEEYVGAIVFRGVRPVSGPGSPSGSTKRKARAQSPTKQTNMVIRGWSVRQKYRRKGIGSALLEDAIRIGKEKDWTNGGVEFAVDHANHKRFLPGMFNGGLVKLERVAEQTLAKKVKEVEAGEKSKKRK